MRKLITWTVVVVIVIGVGAGVWWLFDSGRLVYVTNRDNVAALKPVCDDGFVSRYNDAMYYTVRDGEEQPSIDVEAVHALEAEVATLEGYQGDATCQTILFWTAVYDDDYDAARSAYDVIMSLHDEYKYADTNLRVSEPLFTYEGALNSLSGYAQSNNVETSE